MSKGILDVASKDAFTQIVSDTLASLVTVIIGVFSIYQMVSLHKHQITVEGQQNLLAKPDVSQKVSTPPDGSGQLPPAAPQTGTGVVQ